MVDGTNLEAKSMFHHILMMKAGSAISTNAFPVMKQCRSQKRAGCNWRILGAPMPKYTLNTGSLSLEVIPNLETPWAVAYYGPGEKDQVVVEGWRREWYRDTKREDMMVADLLVELYAMLTPLIGYEVLRPMCNIGNFQKDPIGDADPEWIMDQEFSRVLEDAEALTQLVQDTISLMDAEKIQKEENILGGLEDISSMLVKEIHHQEVINDFECPKVRGQLDLFAV